MNTKLVNYRFSSLENIDIHKIKQLVFSFFTHPSILQEAYPRACKDVGDTFLAFLEIQMHINLIFYKLCYNDITEHFLSVIYRQRTRNHKKKNANFCDKR